MGKKKEAKTVPSDFNKYEYYESTVQSVENDIDFVLGEYKKIRKKSPRVLREDFCGTGKLACAWVQQHKDNISHGVDLDPEPVDYGKKHHYSKLNKEEASRMTYYLKNVLEAEEIKADMILAFNFSYFIFKKRSELLTYFKSVRNSLSDDGVFFLDLFGGPESQTVLEERTSYDGYKYFWDCDKFDAITNECLFKIHFKPKGHKKVKDVFVYDWRLWGMAELRDILADAGFSKTFAYWEEDDDEGEGNGDFFQTETAENCPSWVTYIAATP